MQLSQSFSFCQSYSFKGVCASLVIVAVSGSIIFNRVEPLLIPLTIFPIGIGKNYFNNKQELKALRSQHNSLEFELTTALEIQQQQKVKLLELQQENTQLKNIHIQDLELIRQLQSKIDSLENSLTSLQKTIEYYEEEIVNENQILDEQNKLLKQTVSELKSQQELLREEWKTLQQKQATIIAKKTSVIDLDRAREKRINTIDLSESKLAIVGGHPRVQNSIINSLKRDYNLEKAIVVAADGKDKRVSQQHIKDALKNCDYIIAITGNLSGYIQTTVRKLKKNGHLKGDILTITESRGESGVLREIKKFLDVNSN